MKAFALSLLLVFSALLFSAVTLKDKQYKCLPCGHDCDKEVYSGPGTCKHCNMPLVEASTITFKTIDPPQLCVYLQKHPKTILLDVRTKEEFEGKAKPDYGTLKNALNIPIQELSNRLTEIATLKDREIIVYCSHSHRSSEASYQLTQSGFTNVINLTGGMSVFKDNSCKK